MAKDLTQDEQYVVNESPELSLGEARGWTDRLLKLFPAFGNRNYQLYFMGQLVSMIGTWLQIVAQGWLVLQLTNSAFLIGLVAAAATVPTLIFSLFGGVIGDRFAKRKILQFTQSASMVLAFILGILTVLHVITIGEIILLAFLLGVVTAIDLPARQAFVVELVGKDLLPSAIALNSGLFNSARVIGPSIAGFLIAIIGTGGAFIANAVSYIAVIIALIYIRVNPIISRQQLHPIKAIKEGISYSFSHPIIRTLLIFVAITSIFGWSYTTILPVIAKNTFHKDAAGLGYLYTASGLGALLASIFVSAYGRKVNPLAMILGGNALFAFSMFIFTLTSALPLALVCLFFAGMGLLLQFSTMNTTIQNMIEDNYRGRVMSLYTIMFLGLAPLGNLEIGFLSEKLGTGFAIRIGMIIVFCFGFLIFVARKRIRNSYREYQRNEE